MDSDYAPAITINEPFYPDIPEPPWLESDFDVTYLDSGQFESGCDVLVGRIESHVIHCDSSQMHHVWTLKLADDRLTEVVWLPGDTDIEKQNINRERDNCGEGEGGIGGKQNSLPTKDSVVWLRLTQSAQFTQSSKCLLPSSDPQFQGLPIVANWSVIESDFSLAYLTRWFDQAVDAHDLLRLLAFIARLQDRRLRKLLTDLFSIERIAWPFVTLGASRNHHHNQAGGLLLHSLQCAEWLELLARQTLSQLEAELTLVTALLHDLGKVETLTQSDSSQLVSHEILSLTLMEPLLRKMESYWKQGAYVLRQMLGWPLESNKFPKLPSLLLVKLADQYSTALSARDKAFAGLPTNFYFATLKTPTSIQYFNRVV